jgi:hypothetical protein
MSDKLRRYILSPLSLVGTGQGFGDKREIGLRQGSIFLGDFSVDLSSFLRDLHLSGLPEGRLDRATDKRASGKAGLAGEPVNPPEKVKGLWRGQGGRKREDRV